MALSLFLLASSLAAPVAVQADALAPDASSIRYPVDPDALREEFRSFGTLTLQVPVLGQVAFTGKENELTRHGDRDLGVPYLHVLGSAVGHSGSTANLLVGKQGVYGHAELPAADGHPAQRIRFDARQAASGLFEEVVEVSQALPDFDPPGSPGSPPGAGGNHSGHHHGPSALPVPRPALTPPIHGLATGEDAEVRNAYQTDDDEMDSWFDHDYVDDYAEKTVDLPPGALTGAKSAWLWVYANAPFCGASGTPHGLYANSALQVSYNSCDKFPGSGFGWAAFGVDLAALVPGQTNSFVIYDGGSSWNDRDHNFALDTDTSSGHTAAYSNGVAKAGELMWRLEIRTAAPTGTATKECTHGQQATRDPDLQDTTSTSAPTAPDPCANQPDCSGGEAISWVTYHAEKGYVDEEDGETDWQDRIVTAAAQYVPMFQAICISLRVWTVAVPTNILSSTSCTDSPGASDDYKSWLVNTWFNDPAAWNDDAYQLWTHRDLDGDSNVFDDAYCFGVASTDKVNPSRIGFSADASSIIEGSDHVGADYYDPDETHSRGIVSGHELAHVYGEENHPYDCNANDWYGTDECSIMRNCQTPEDRQFWLTWESQREIMFRFHYLSEASTSSDGQPGCP